MTAADPPDSPSARSAGSQYFAESPTVASKPVDAELWLPDMQLRLRTDRGVFGYGRIDAGTTLLLQRGGAPAAAGNLLDLGCGVGPIAITLARRSPGASVWAVDVNDRARSLCVTNAEANDVAVHVASPDEVPDDLRFAEIWSNPPIRVGKAALHDLLLTWLPRLDDGGSAHLVVQKHLGADSLQRWLTEQGWPTERTGSAAGYRLLRVRRGD